MNLSWNDLIEKKRDARSDPIHVPIGLRISPYLSPVGCPWVDSRLVRLDLNNIVCRGSDRVGAPRPSARPRALEPEFRLVPRLLQGGLQRPLCRITGPERLRLVCDLGRAHKLLV